MNITLWKNTEISTGCSGDKYGIAINRDCQPVRNSSLLIYCYWLRWRIQLLEEVRPVGFRLATSSSFTDCDTCYSWSYRLCWYKHSSIQIGLSQITQETATVSHECDMVTLLDDPHAGRPRIFQRKKGQCGRPAHDMEIRFTFGTTLLFMSGAKWLFMENIFASHVSFIAESTIIEVWIWLVKPWNGCLSQPWKAIIEDLKDIAHNILWIFYDCL